MANLSSLEKKVSRAVSRFSLTNETKDPFPWEGGLARIPVSFVIKGVNNTKIKADNVSEISNNDSYDRKQECLPLSWLMMSFNHESAL